MEKIEKTRPIGIFDSGIGGLTVFAAIKKHLPNESLVYLGDTARVPYGTKTAETVAKYSIENTSFLKEKGVKAIVVACNTASALALPQLVSKFNLPIIGVIKPGAATAVQLSKKNCIGVIGTEATISSNAYSKEIKKNDSNIKIISQACPLFVPLVEEGWIDNEVAHLITEKYLLDMKKEDIDVLVLGCTHYPLLKKVISGVMGDNIKLVDSAEATASALKNILESFNIKNNIENKPEYNLYVTDLPAKFEIVASRFLKQDIPKIRHISL